MRPTPMSSAVSSSARVLLLPCSMMCSAGNSARRATYSSPALTQSSHMPHCFISTAIAVVRNALPA